MKMTEDKAMKCERCGTRVEYARFCNSCCTELFGTGNCSRCGAPDAPFIGLGPLGGGDPDGDDYFCDDCTDEMMACVVQRTDPDEPTAH
jgi:hypothetical protein